MCGGVWCDVVCGCLRVRVTYVIVVLLGECFCVFVCEFYGVFVCVCVSFVCMFFVFCCVVCGVCVSVFKFF